MAISKVTLNGETLMDVTQDTVASNNLLTGETATGADGEPVIGEYSGGGGVSFSLVVTVESGAAVTATNGSKTVTGTSSGGTCTLTLPEAGTWTVSATKSGQTSGTKTVSVVDTYAVTLTMISSTLNDNDWSVIRAVSDAGRGSEYWSVGDRKAVTLNGTVAACTFSNTVVYAFIIGFNHNSGYEGENRIHFQFGKTAASSGTDVAFVDSKYNSSVVAAAFHMNTGESNIRGWSDSSMRKKICGTSLSSYSDTFIAALPSDLRSVLKTVTKYTDNTGDCSMEASAVTKTTDVVFLLAEHEVFGTISYANTNESKKQAQYAYYSAGNSKTKYKHSDTSTAAIWWLRSPTSGSSDSFAHVTESGSCGYSLHARYSCGFAPAFCV